MALLLILIFIVLPIAELYVIIQVAGAIGAPLTIALLLVDGFIGAALARSQGRAVWRKFNEAMTAGRVPGKEASDGAMIVFGGALLLSPGFLTDILGFALLLPPTRALVRRAIVGSVKRGTAAGRIWVLGSSVGGGLGGPGPGERPGGTGPRPGPGGTGSGWPPPPRSKTRRDYDVEGTAREVDDDPRLGDGGDGNG